MSLELIVAAGLLLVLGAAGGFLAGLLGIGGGAVFVPGLYYILRYFEYSEHAMHIAVGTSLLTIVVTGISSARAHHRRDAVDMGLLKQFLPGVFLGVILGTFLADIFSTVVLKFIFAASQIAFGIYMLWPSKGPIFQSLPKQPWFSVIASANSCLATLMGVGGGVQNVTFMTICNVVIHRAIATAAAIGPFIAVIGAAGFLYIGLDVDGLPPLSLGYLNFAAFGIIILTSAVFAPVGVGVAHNLPVKTLKRYFGIFMMLVSTKMLLEIFTDFSVM